MSYRTEMDLGEMTFLMSALNHYNQLPMSFTQLDPAQRESLQAFWEKVLKGKKYVDGDIYSEWKDADLHIVSQLWSNTSCGWEGIGGSAMSSAYTTIIENRAGAIFVYYNGQLAYVAAIDEKLKPYREEGYKKLPGMLRVSRILTVIYKKSFVKREKV